MIRRACDSTPGSAWWEWLPDISIVLRMTIARSQGFTPYYLVYKSEPSVPGLMDSYLDFPDLSEESDPPDMVAEALERAFTPMLDVVRLRLD